jgi:hypothetical protein
MPGQLATTVSVLDGKILRKTGVTTGSHRKSYP